LIEKAVHFWGRAGQRSLERSSLVEAIEQLSHALSKITTLPTSRALRHEEIKLQVALVGLPDHWFITFYPSNDIRINCSDPVPGQTGRLFLPFDAAIGRNVTDKLVVSFEAGVPIVDAYPVYKFKAELRVILKF
jgi:hypothetical protein